MSDLDWAALSLIELNWDILLSKDKSKNMFDNDVKSGKNGKPKYCNLMGQNMNEISLSLWLSLSLSLFLSDEDFWVNPHPLAR